MSVVRTSLSCTPEPTSLLGKLPHLKNLVIVAHIFSRLLRKPLISVNSSLKDLEHGCRGINFIFHFIAAIT